MTVELKPLNVIIGPNGSGKSNFVEILEFLKSVPTGIGPLGRDVGGYAEWFWKGSRDRLKASICAVCNISEHKNPLRYGIELTQTVDRYELTDEFLEECAPRPPNDDVYFFYRFQNGYPAINTRQNDGVSINRFLRRESLLPSESVMSQRRDPDLYPELTGLAKSFSSIQTYREWAIGRSAPLRLPQPTDLPNDVLLSDARNLGLILNALEHGSQWMRFNEYLRRFLPRFKYLTTRINAGTLQVFLHEDHLTTPIPATRLSDGTIRFIALLAILLGAGASPLICLEDPELGLHPDALSLVAELLVEASEKTQLIVTTQSDSLIARLSDQVDSVLVCENNGGKSELRRLSSERLSSWLSDYSLGDLWKMGQLGGNP